jgi:hypothetical protein
MKNKWRISDLLQSGIIFSAVSFLIGIGNMLFQVVIGHQLPKSGGEYGLVQTTLSFVGFLSLPVPAAINAVTHYIARFHYEKDHERLHHLLVGCRRFLFYLTVGGSVAAIVLIKPLSVFFNFPASLMLVALVCVLTGLWSSFATALCQGLAWFKRLAFLGLLAVVIRILFTWVTTKIWPTAELAVLASAVMLLAYLIVLFWKDEFPRRDGVAESPWTPEFIQFLIVCGTFSLGAYCFTQGDLLVVQRYFLKGDRDTYSAAGMLTRNLPTTVAPMLVVLFTHRSGRHHGDAIHDQLKLLALYAAGLIGSAIALFVLRDFCLKIIFGKADPECATMIGRLAPTMVFVGLLQALGTWSLASHWIKLALLYCGLGVAYWLALFFLGKSPDDLLRIMPVASGISFGLLFLFWLIAMRNQPRNFNQC